MMKYLKGILLPALLALAPFAASKEDAPALKTSEFSGELVNIFYFEDSDVAVLAELETSKVYRSTDAGKTWGDPIDSIRTLGIIKSPFDNKVAVALGEQRHWITYDRGDTWDEFKTEYPPSLMGTPISFHAKDNKKLLYHSIEDCFLSPCLGSVRLGYIFPVKLTNMVRRHYTRTMASKPIRKRSSTTARCAYGRRAPIASSWTKTNTTTGYCVSRAENTRIDQRTTGC
jgi:hypothetical protein